MFLSTSSVSEQTLIVSEELKYEILAIFNAHVRHHELQANQWIYCSISLSLTAV